VKQINGMVVGDMFRRVCSSDQIKEDTMNFFVVDHIEVIVGRKGGKLFAFNNSCPHRGASLSKGELKDTRIVCYMHGYEYDIFTGRLQNMKSWKKETTWMEQNPEWRKSGNLIIYSVIEENGNIFLNV
jgi:nitrite reductase/ring-hydroxylating ferredoxin subunit